jgi:uncharacterized protein YutE (UPF0331/DUF86 family)
VVDEGVVLERLSRLDHYVRKLRQVAAFDRDRYLSDEDLQRQTERYLQLAIECTIDIGSHILATEGLGRPDSYAEIFRRLAMAGIFPVPFGEELAKMAGFRNALVHDYLDLDPNRVFGYLSQLDDFVSFAQYIEALLRSE